ncbi:MAG: nicotinate phosphoribosyltransferase, partial [Acholeplasmataceae bacterium]|nr:nicotinate phosphoribosyltransferase [Acholeplasmataceae bacterium]
AAVFGARAAYISGAIGSSNTYADYAYQIPAIGTMAHSFVQSYQSEYDAFKAYARIYPDDCVLLVDTYDSLKSGLPNAIRIQKEVLGPIGKTLKGIRLDSGDLTYLSKRAREILDHAGLEKTTITVSNSLDEFLIRDLIHQGARIDAFGVGERLVTARSEAVFGGVFKLAAITEDGVMKPKIKVSDNVSKTTLPGFKQVYRFYDQENKAVADVITLKDETIDPTKPYRLFDPDFPWKSKTITDFTVRPMLIDIYKEGVLLYQRPSLEAIRAYAALEIKTLWDEVLRLESPHLYYVDLSEKLWTLKEQLLNEVKP